jgi:4-diphosphocytidyl-2-C-methyl-D-erythritol kinase
MHSYSLIAPAKINLYLEIIGERPDGYHELVMIMQSIALADHIALRSNGTEIVRLYCDNPEVPLTPDNLAYRAAELMKKNYPKQAANYGGLDITIEKNIPVAAGLAGGSTDGAAVLVGISLIWELGLTVPELQSLGAELGSDVPFCISGGTAIATGRGEEIEPIDDLDNLWVVLAKYRTLNISTPWAYQTYRKQFNHTYITDSQGVQSRTKQVHSGPLVQAIHRRNSSTIGKLLHNDLEKVVFPEYPQVAQLRQVFENTDCLGTMMSGSGPTVFALCQSELQAGKIEQQVREKIADPDLQFWITKLSSEGIRVR